MSFRRPAGLLFDGTPPRETIAFAIHGPILRSDLPGLCDRVCAILTDAPADEAFCDVRGVEPDAVTVDALARLQLAARRRGCRVRLRNARRRCSTWWRSWA